MISKIRKLLKKFERSDSILFRYQYTRYVLARDLEKLFIEEQKKILKDLEKRLYPKKKGGEKK